MKQSWIEDNWEFALGGLLSAVGVLYMTYLWGLLGLIYAIVYAAFGLMLILYFGHLMPWPDWIYRRYWGDR